VVEVLCKNIWEPPEHAHPPQSEYFQEKGPQITGKECSQQFI